jgi:translation initiation factor 5B
MLEKKKIPFVVALNKIDRIYEWKPAKFRPFQDSLSAQEKSVQMEFEERVKGTKLAFAEKGYNVELYNRNEDEEHYFHMIPTSAITGEGIPDLLLMLIRMTQKFYRQRITLDRENVEATVLELKVTEGFGTTIDVILRNGVLKVNDRIILCGLQGPIDTRIKTLLQPNPLTELRVKGAYSKPNRIQAAIGLKIVAPDLEKVIPGSSVIVCGQDDDAEDLKEEVMEDLEGMLAHSALQDVGVCVQASTIGSLEALLSFLEDQKIPVCGINIGPIHLKDVKKAQVMHEHEPMYACILGFNVKVDRDAQLLADKENVTIFTAEIIYHLEKMFMDHIEGVRMRRKLEASGKAVFPCWLRIKDGCVFNKRDPIIVGVDVKAGTLRPGTPLVAWSKDGPVSLGKVLSVEVNHKNVEVAKKGTEAAVKIAGNGNMIGRQFQATDEIYSLISRESIDAIKQNFKDDITQADLQLFVQLKKRFGII